MFKNENEQQKLWDRLYFNLLKKNAICEALPLSPLYVKYARDEMKEPMWRIQNKFDAAKYRETGFFFVLGGRTVFGPNNCFFMDEYGKLVVPCSLNGWTYGPYYDFTVDEVVNALRTDLSNYIAKHPDDVGKIPTKTFWAIPTLSDDILARYSEVMQDIYRALPPNSNKEKAVKSIQQEVTYLNRVFNLKEAQAYQMFHQKDEELLPKQLFARDRTVGMQDDKTKTL